MERPIVCYNKGEVIHVLYSDHIASTLCGWDPADRRSM